MLLEIVKPAVDPEVWYLFRPQYAYHQQQKRTKSVVVKEILILTTRCLRRVSVEVSSENKKISSARRAQKVARDCKNEGYFGWNTDRFVQFVPDT
jgi:hypothetical protein